MYLYLAKTMETSLVHIFNNHQIYLFFFNQLRLKPEIPSNAQVSQGIPVQIFDATLQCIYIKTSEACLHCLPGNVADDFKVPFDNVWLLAA